MRPNIVVFVIVASAWTAGCGGASSVEGRGKDAGAGGAGSGAAGSSGSSGSSVGSGSGSGSGSSDRPDGGALPCPTKAPSGGDPCSVPNLECEYPDGSGGKCMWFAQCNGGSWLASQETDCQSYGNCPASYGEAPVGQDCAPNGLSCSYPQGVCNCLGTSDGGYLVWSCVAPGNGCPEPRPLLGTACTKDGLDCGYGGCFFDELCTGGYWQRSPYGVCP